MPNQQLAKLNDHGQRFWLDSLSRDMLDNGQLESRIREQGLSGITSNPAIFRKAMADSPSYDDRIGIAVETLARDGSVAAEAVYEQLATDDVRDACDLLMPIHEATDGLDGFVSLEVSPHLAYDPVATLRQARDLWDRVGRPNLFIKVPGTPQGLHAVETLLVEGINVNITLLFGRDAYEQTLQTYLRAMEQRLRDGKDLHNVASVASFFLSRIDTAVDRELRQRIDPQVDERIVTEAESLLGRTAVANAQLAYARYREVGESERWQRLAKAGARPQRLVWASTGTKDPSLSDTHYVESLILPETISTMPEATADAFDDHGWIEVSAAGSMSEAAELLERLQRKLEIDFDAITHQLVAEGVQKFIDPYDQLMQRLAERIEHRQESIEEAERATPLVGEASRLRAEVLRMTSRAGSGHATSALSCADLVTALFFHEMRWDPSAPGARDQDRFLLSKGHAAPILWAALSEAGAIETDPLTLRQIDSDLEGHPTPRNPWIPVATGSLGQGLSAVNGMALADRLDGISARLFCLLGDGECSEGSVWEAAQFAADQRLEQIVAIVDANGLEQSGPAPYGHDTSVLAGRFRAFGWRTLEIDGHDFGAILPALKTARQPGPTAIIARTVKGKGISFLEGAEGWHGKALDEDQLAEALAEINEPDLRLLVEPRRVPSAEPTVATMAQVASERAQQESGLPLKVEYELGEEVATRAAFGAALQKLGSRFPDLVVLDGDVKNSTKTQEFAKTYPERFIEAQIAEQNMLGAALGLSASGKRSCVATFAAFLTRAHDIIRMAAHSQQPRMLICGSHAGISIGEDGPSQMGLEDMAMFRALNGTTVLYPADAVSAERLTETGLEHEGIVYLRTTRGKTPVLYQSDERFEIGGSKTLAESTQDRLTLVAAGITVHTALEASTRLREQGVCTRVIDAYSVKPLDVETLQRAAEETGTLLVIEDHHRDGGLGDAVAAQVGRLGRVFQLGVSGEPRSGSPEDLMERHRISGQQIEREALAIAA
ncbi:transaldolase [Lamprobacter modestohalophilus]|uniref:Transaldolase n=1 Tax=Lamprobacter modestohalophilus TaxID=1064514 RepID=A0A9X1B513_9GAMM|nr:transketolase [Lamprobacter modestohalophilus]MBK1619306.1 transaldolase [Lamprobacter modestohalophilus]